MTTNLMDLLDERLFELNGRMVFARVDFTPTGGPQGTVAWFRADAPFPERPYATHSVYFRDDQAILEGGHYELTEVDAIADAKRRAR